MEETPTTDLEPARTADLEQLQHDISDLDTPEKRFRKLSRNFVESIAIVSAMSKNRDWEKLTNQNGEHYRTLAELVSDALSVGYSYAQRIVQTAENFYSPLKELTAEGAVISITASEAATLGNEGMAHVVESVQENVNDASSPEDQSRIIESAKQEALAGKRDRKTGTPGDAPTPPDMGDFDYNDLSEDGYVTLSDLGIEDTEADDDGDVNYAALMRGGTDASSAGSVDAPNVKKEKARKKPSTESEPPGEYLPPLARIMEGGDEYERDEDIEKLPSDLQEFVRAVNYLSKIDSSNIANQITKDLRGATYNISGAVTKLRLVKTTVEVSEWALASL